MYGKFPFFRIYQLKRTSRRPWKFHLHMSTVIRSFVKLFFVVVVKNFITQTTLHFVPFQFSSFIHFQNFTFYIIQLKLKECTVGTYTV